MGKTMILNLSDVKLKGDVLDVGESFGVIYNLSKDVEDEVAVDYIGSEQRHLLTMEDYDTCTIFFHLSSMWSMNSRINLIKEVTKYLKVGGEICIWDINKEVGTVVNNKINALLPSGKVQEFEFKNINPLCKSNIEDTKIMLEKSYKIEETKLWEEIYYIKAKKSQGSNKNKKLQIS
ncbi:hypothetical protein [Clostridium gasigenes]|uniref:Methyltransferase domain-containing protein n=1 Tax=Clostridium gasigenes TaxID=94869 RepID=A0A7X0SF49_9CLOT|nr:hypothetical protein [Clostridium gasigenes]MBB6714386.1 hypothetical protein [Clostridium gasigenes]MBU3089451.1 hypothetical protein [Clostridium gasigenes]MBU3132978.1 hypothetical protein [Clostridium gasigenes]